MAEAALSVMAASAWSRVRGVWLRGPRTHHSSTSTLKGSPPSQSLATSLTYYGRHCSRPAPPRSQWLLPRAAPTGPWGPVTVQLAWQRGQSESRQVVSGSLRPHGLSPWNSPGQNTGVGSLYPRQGIFPTQGSNPGLPHRRQVLYQLSHRVSNTVASLK